MKAVVFYILIAVMFLGVPLCAYQYYVYSEMETEQANTSNLFSGEGSQAHSYSLDDTGADDRSSLEAEKLGFLGATIALFLIPTLMIVFRGRLIKY